MPCYDVQCIHGHRRMVYYASHTERRLEPEICPECGHTQSFVISRPGSYTYFSESNPVVLENLGHEPVTVTSHWQHQKLMRERGLGWITPKRGEKGCWA